jgi:beta-glucanase (GH16 family)
VSTHRRPSLQFLGGLAVVAALLGGLPGCGGAGHGTSPRPPGPPTPDPTPGAWTLVFDDEFGTPGSPDPARWAYDIGTIANNEAQYYTSRADNVRVEDGTLVIEARREPWAGQAYTSGRIKTQGLEELLYGRVEVRAKLPTGRGTWPAIWMLGADIDRVGWPACGEIDIMENVGFDPTTIVASVHTAAYNHVQGTQKSAKTTLTRPAPWEDFHVYALEWSPDRIEALVDGRRYFTFRNEGTGSATWPFDRPQFLVLNLAIGGTWGGQHGIDDSLFPHRMYVDYVRVYRASQDTQPPRPHLRGGPETR